MARYLGLAASATGTAVLFGWLVNSATLKTVGGTSVPMRANTALALLLLGAALASLAKGSTRLSHLARTAALAAAGLGGLTLVEWRTGWELGIDHLLFGWHPSAPFPNLADRSAPEVAVCLCLSGLAVAMLDRGTLRGWVLNQLLSLASGLIALYVLLGYLLEHKGTLLVAETTEMAAHTAAALLAIDVGVWLARPQHGAMAIVSSEAVGGKMTRRVLLPMVALLVALGWMRVQAQALGWVHTLPGAVALMLADMVALAAVLLTAARSLSTTDVARAAAEEVRRAQAAELVVAAAALAETAAQLEVTAAELHKVAKTNELILQHMPGGLSVVDPAGNFLVFNAAAQELMRQGPGGTELTPFRTDQHIVREDGVTALSPDDSPTARALRGETVTDFVSCVHHEDGTLAWLSTTATPLLDDDQQVQAAIVVFRDITVQHTAKEELRKSAEVLAHRSVLLSHKNEEVEAFVYVVSHDLRSPLVTIQGFCRELVTSVDDLKAALQPVAQSEAVAARIGAILDQDMAEALRFIVAGTDKFERLINALLLLSRVGRRELKIEELNADALVDTTLDAMRVQVVASGAQIQRSQLPKARGDATAVGQVFANLIDNSLKYLQVGRAGHIEIGGEAQATESHYWVRDNGMGFPDGARNRLFQVFQRFHPDVAGGEGMGLTVVKRSVERQGGRVWVDSVAGQGTTMHFTLPNTPASGPAEVYP